MTGLELLQAIIRGEHPTAPIQTTLEFKVNLVKAITVATGRIVAEGRIVHRGSRVATAEGRLTAAADGTLLAHATTTCIVLPPRA